ncbi:MAG: phosphomannomutase/phosphoglucomutase [Spirochaetaceae bacterium]|nr:phosphomannomutase/phosphoglucomutase [Spirochaetaceae bacterium]MCF7947315.1 phosphomannomutase/phosphoglucomutase [Spirochaetia bacterium]MCF7950541.1 phosphomannomutase/phosphoglucomutase [Spirochaetaceae bacterium]
MIFKTNDIRGIYPKELSYDTVYRIGYYLKTLLNASKVLVGRDTRTSSPAIYDALKSGIIDSGSNVINIGICDTPAVYFASMKYGYDAVVMITASHNPPEYNGLKISRENAIPIGRESGLSNLETLIKQVPSKGEQRGVETDFDIQDDYVEFLKLFDLGIRNIKCIFDCGNGAAGRFVNEVFQIEGLDFDVLYQEPDGEFPNRGPDPLSASNQEPLHKAVLESGADVGVCFDGDGDRAIFIDEKGNFVSPDLITALIARYYRYKTPDKELRALYDIRSSRSVKEYIKKMGGHSDACPTGHARIKHLMRKNNYSWAGELAGHYYYSENAYCDSAFITVLVVLSVLSRERKSLSVLSNEINPYYFSGEINFFVEDIPKKIQELAEIFFDGEKNYTDGLRIDYPEWWFIIRESNAEPLLRLVVEAKNAELMNDKVTILSNLIEKGV